MLLRMLCEQGCSRKFILAIAQSLYNTRNLLGSETFRSQQGVRQGGTTSASLFNFYIDKTASDLDTYGPDGFLQNLHCLLYMDDIVILATTKEAMSKKLAILKNSTRPIGKKIHPSSQNIYVSMTTTLTLCYG
jgi:hypothetical protein